MDKQTETALREVAGELGMEEKVVTIAFKFYEARRLLKKLYPEKFGERMEEFGVILYGSMRKLRTDQALVGVKPLVEAATDRGNGFEALWFMAAAVEWIEGHLTAKTQGWPTEIVWKEGE